MTHGQKRIRLIELLQNERGEHYPVPAAEYEQRLKLRGLLNTRPPMPPSAELLALQDEYLREELRSKRVTTLSDLSPAEPDIYLWRGDITTLSCDGIVNAANSQLLGCFIPNHRCIDNAIHTFAGIQLRLECARLMNEQGHGERTGGAKLTRAYNLPCKYVLHTVGPIVFGALTPEHEAQLVGCYRACLELADKNGLGSLAFCCISTGEFRFPNARAATLAIAAVREYKNRTSSKIKVIFNVFKDCDYEIYAELLGVAPQP